MVLKEMNHGWAKQADELLENWGLEKDWTEIQAKSKRTWKMEVKNAAERLNKDKIRGECETRIRGEVKQRTKTKTIASIISNPQYQRKTDDFISKHPSIALARAYIMGKFAMLDCANNFSNKYGGKVCRKCGVVDDETHRINNCSLYRSINRETKVDFDDIFSTSNEKVMSVVQCIFSVWDLERGKNEMRATATE